LIEWLNRGTHSNYFFWANFNLGYSAYLYIFVIVLTFFLLRTIEIFYLKKTIAQRSNTLIFSFVSLGILFSYYSTSLFHPQYLCWFIPLYLLLIERFNKEKALLFSFILINLLFFPMLLFWGRHTTLGLFLPTSKAVGGVPAETLFSPINKIANIAKSVLSAIFIFTMAEMLKIAGSEE